MTKADRIVSDLMDALDKIRQAVATEASVHYIDGLAEQAMKNCEHQRVRNSDGYLVVRHG